MYYSEICRFPLSKNFSKEEKLFTIGSIDADAYIRVGQISLDDIELTIFKSVIGKLYSGTYYALTHQTTAEKGPNQRLIDFIMQLEVLMFEADTPLLDQALVDAVLGKRIQ